MTDHVAALRDCKYPSRTGDAIEQNLAAAYLERDRQVKELSALLWAVDTDNYHVVCNDVGNENWWDAMTDHEELLKQLDEIHKRKCEGVSIPDKWRTPEGNAAAAIRSLQAQLAAERKMRTVVETDCANERKAREEAEYEVKELEQIRASFAERNAILFERDIRSTEHAKAAERRCAEAVRHLINLQPHIAQLPEQTQPFIDSHVDAAIRALAPAAEREGTEKKEQT